MRAVESWRAVCLPPDSTAPKRKIPENGGRGY